MCHLLDTHKTCISMTLYRNSNMTMSVLKEITIQLQAVYYLITLIKVWLVLLGYSDDLLAPGDRPCNTWVSSHPRPLFVLIPCADNTCWLPENIFYQSEFWGRDLFKLSPKRLPLQRCNCQPTPPSLIQNQYIPKWIHITGAEVCITIKRSRRCSRWDCFIHCWFTVMGTGNIHSL